MVSKILIAVAALLILAGLLGLKMKTVGKRLLFLGVAAMGMVLLAAAEMNTYGLVGGCFQLIYRLVAWIPCMLLVQSICKHNEIRDIGGLRGIGRKMPYTYALLVILSVVMIGVPVTGTFTGIIYSEIGLLAGNFGALTYMGLLGNVLGIVVPAALLFPVLRYMYFPCKDEEQEPEMVEMTISDSKEAAAPSKGLLTVSWVLAMILIVFSLYQQPVLEVTSTVMQKIFS